MAVKALLDDKSDSGAALFILRNFVLFLDGDEDAPQLPRHTAATNRGPVDWHDYHAPHDSKDMADRKLESPGFQAAETTLQDDSGGEFSGDWQSLEADSHNSSKRSTVSSSATSQPYLHPMEAGSDVHSSSLALSPTQLPVRQSTPKHSRLQNTQMCGK